MEKEEERYYLCNAKQCVCKQMIGEKFMICSACFETANSKTIDSKHGFLFCKVASMMDRIKTEIKQCKDNDERRRYMFLVYRILYTQCIAKLSEMMNESEYNEIQ
eukprot:582016_1